MRSQVRFVMHCDDEQALLGELLKDPSVAFIDGPRWKDPKPQTVRTLESIGNYCIIWSPEDLLELEARFIPTCSEWYCESEHSTIQFLRSSLNGDILTDGRFAVSTLSASAEAASGVERRFKAIRRFIKKHYSNAVLQWSNTELPMAPAGPSRSANPSKPDNSLWVGPAAMTWLRADDRRRVKTVLGSPVEALLVPPSPN